MVDTWSSFLSINKVELFGGDLSCFLNALSAKILHCSVSGDVFFTFHLMKEREMMVMAVHKSVYQGVLVLVMGLSGSFSSCDEA